MMNTPHEDLRSMVRIRQYLQEAQDLGSESGVAFDSSEFDASNPAAPASVMTMIDDSAERADAVIKNLEKRLETPESG